MNGGLHGYDVTHVQGIDHNNFERDAYKICVDVSPFDFQEFTMTIPFQDYPQFSGCCVLLKGPSRPF
eukprot:12653525-Ditylum_brightwellii.AAC.1